MALRRLKAGPLSAGYESASLRAIKLGDHEVLRHVYVALRDKEWITIPARLVRETVEQSEEGFRIELTVEHVSREIDFVWEGTIEGAANGSIRWTMSGEARRPFQRNRIGFCVLHPIAECAGAPCVIVHPDGERQTLRFPNQIAPHQPFLDVRSISHEVRRGLMAEVHFAGAIFETEDQRNWTDGSFKTYSTPLSLPYPVTVRPGERIEQAVNLSLHSSPVRVLLDPSTKFRLPELDVERIDFRFDRSSPEGDACSRRGDGPCEIAFFTNDPVHDLVGVLPLLASLDVRRYLIFPPDGSLTTPELVDAARRILGTRIPIGGGSNANFAELNRNQEIASSLDFLSWAVDPSIHANDTLTMIDNLEGQSATLVSARAFAQGKALRITRMKIPLIPCASGWLAASISHLGQTGVDSISFGQPHQLLADISAFCPESLISVYSSDPLRAYALSLQSHKRIRTWLANFLDERQTVVFEDAEMSLEPYELRCIDLEIR